MLPDGAFTALLLLVSGVSAVRVPPPTNVTVSCQNFNVTASWEYSHQQPQTSFHVEIRDSERKSVGNTTDHQCNLSSFIWKTEKPYLDRYYVNITAIQEGVWSEPVPSKTLTFNTLKTADITCQLDFPPANLTVTDSGPSVKFRNPAYFYSELAAFRQEGNSFQFSITANGNVSLGSCPADQEICSRDVSFPEGADKCVTLKGDFNVQDGLSQIPFSETGQICSSDSTDLHVILLVFLLIVAIILIVVITVCICKEKAWTVDIPKPTVTDPGPRPQTNRQYLDLKEEKFNDITVGPFPDSSMDNSSSDCQSSDYLNRGPLRDRRDEQEAEGLLEDGYREDSLDDSEKTETFSLNMEEAAEGGPGPYDSPQNLPVDMGDGETITAYKGR